MEALELHESLDGADREFRERVASVLTAWTAVRERGADKSDLEWFYEIASAASTLGLSPEEGSDFVCDACGGLADILDAAAACSEGWFDLDLTGSGLRHALRTEARGGEPIRPASIQSTFGWSFEDSLSALETAVTRGLLVRTGKGYRFGRPLCANCYEVRAAAPHRARRVAPQAVSGREQVPAQLRFRVLQRDGFRCTYCGRGAREGAVLHLDHVVPVAAGGETDEGNLITACEACNLGKSTTEVV